MSRASDPPTANVDEIQLSSQLELPRLVDLASARLAVKVEYDPAVLKGTVALRGLDALSGEQLWDLTNQLLASRGFTTVRPPGADTYSVVRLQDAAAIAGLGGLPSLVEKVQQSGNEPALEPAATAPLVPPAGFSADVVRLDHLAPKDAADAVKLVLSKTGSTATPLGKNLLRRAIEVTGRRPCSRSVRNRLDALDCAGFLGDLAMRHPSI